MNIITIILIALGLAMDAFAVSITTGVRIKRHRVSNALKIGLLFGAFQAFMPVLGWLAGYSFQDLISEIDHWLAFILLTIIGIKMIYESFKLESNNEVDNKAPNPIKLNILLILAIATSIDALAVGFTFAFLEISIITPVIIIGLVTFLLSFLGVFIGNKLGDVFQNKVQIIGGLILIGIGIKILTEHLL